MFAEVEEVRKNNEEGKWQVAYWILTFVAGTIALSMFWLFMNEATQRETADMAIHCKIDAFKDSVSLDLTSIKGDMREIKGLLTYIAEKK